MNALLLDRAQLSLPELSFIWQLPILASQPNTPSTPPQIDEPHDNPVPRPSPDELPISDPPYPAPGDHPLPPSTPQPELPTPIVSARPAAWWQAALR